MEAPPASSARQPPEDKEEIMFGELNHIAHMLQRASARRRRMKAARLHARAVETPRPAEAAARPAPRMEADRVLEPA
jgi:hypothetical protein